MQYFSPKDLHALLQQSPENIRLWSIEFARHLSESAVPKRRGQHRSYTQADVSVLGLVADYANRSIPFNQIHKAIDDGERMTPTSIITPTPPDTTLALQSRIIDLELELAAERAQRHEAEGQVKLLERLLREANERLFRRDW